MQRKLTDKQLAKWLRSLPQTTKTWELMCNPDTTMQQIEALSAAHAAARDAASQLNEALRSLDSSLTANAESDAGENMPAELNDSDMLGYWAAFHSRLAGAAGQIWESEGRDLNAELGKVVY